MCFHLLLLHLCSVSKQHTRNTHAGQSSSQWVEVPRSRVETVYEFICKPVHLRDGIGQFAHMPHFLKVMDSCKAAYTNYQVRTQCVTFTFIQRTRKKKLCVYGNSRTRSLLLFPVIRSFPLTAVIYTYPLHVHSCVCLCLMKIAR